MNFRQNRGLTRRQADTLRHITRCPGCGEWIVTTYGNPHPLCADDEQETEQCQEHPDDTGA